MATYKLIVEYEGSGFCGWQVQKYGPKPSVESALESAIKCFCGEQVKCYAAGRTDSGVHARGMAVSFSSAQASPARVVMAAVNYYLMEAGIGAAIVSAAKAKSDFHARFSCKSREYEYRILDRPAISPILAGLVWHVPRRLDAKAMHEAAQILVGHHDFSSFRGSKCQAGSPVKTLDFIDVRRRGGLVCVRIGAKSFLYHQVRNIVGTLKLVGEGRLDKAGLKEILDSKLRAAAGPTAPPDGLYFTKARY